MNHKIKENICLLWHRFGPYHYARFRATSKQGPVLGVEFSGSDSTYAWKKINPSRLDRVITLFPGRDSQTIPPDEIDRKVSSVLTAQKPSAVFIPGWSDKTALAALRWCLTRAVPAVVMSPSQEADAPRNWWKEWIKRRVVRLFSGGLAGGSPQKRYLESLGIPKDRILTGYNVIDNAHFEKGARRAGTKTGKYRKLLGLPEKYFICSTRFVPKKNLDRLIRAYSRYLQAGLKKEWSLVLLGDGALRPKLETLIQQQGLKGKVLLPGFKQYDELPHYYALAQVLVLPSVSEQWGLVVNEAMACGLPVLVSNRCGCAEDLVENGENGFTFDPFDLNSMTEALVKITRLESLLPRMGSRSRQIIRAWSPNRFSKQVWTLTGIAVETIPRKADWIDHLILAWLSRRIMTGYQDR